MIKNITKEAISIGKPMSVLLLSALLSPVYNSQICKVTFNINIIMIADDMVLLLLGWAWLWASLKLLMIILFTYQTLDSTGYLTYTSSFFTTTSKCGSGRGGGPCKTSPVRASNQPLWQGHSIFPVPGL
ncbi:hypothetical protein Solca_2004 [Solitalea canadensis DSM 3403]|uniref:Uncharacterized protein n=1 Tax=Solitalea canadensis (strain ATCC 29591 / DSM 3403 / JCM 21819 / LMG 8368 / NBRC 15130 / NCIMB 12057 / USAM 9D) TaxID=929556 RepID=H8KW38_SOLCM|nr:hypothetical protein Solca_2004 [Solitalea canadensis DSM 3403]